MLMAIQKWIRGPNKGRCPYSRVSSMNKLGSLPFLEKKILLTYSAKFQAQAAKKVFMGRQLFWLGGMLGSVLRLPRTLQTGEQRFLFFAVIKSRYFPKSWVLKKHSQYQKCHSITIGGYMWMSRFLKRVTVTSSPCALISKSHSFRFLHCSESR